MEQNEKQSIATLPTQKLWLDWIIEVQSIVQCGLAYVKDIYDKERYERLRELSAEMLSRYMQVPLEKAKDLFCNEEGYQTPKLDTRAAIFDEDKILLVQENDGNWTLPGGWVDVNQTIASNTEKEVKEEAGLEVKAKKIIALQEPRLHNKGNFLYSICKVFVLCENLGGEFHENSETLDSGYFSLDALPPLVEEKTNKEQIALCFKAYQSEKWEPTFD